MSHRLGVYFAPQHDWASTWDYLRRLQPPVVRILLRGADANIVSRVHVAAPSARISLRWWDIDDGGEGNKLAKLNNPEASGAADAREVYARVERMEQYAAANGLPFPPRNKLLANTTNEPPIWNPGIRAKTVANNRSFIAGLIPHGIPVAAGCINTGHPSEWPPQWDWFAPVVDLLKMSPGSCLELHSYWQLEGPNYEWTDAQGNPRRDWGALAGRYLHCPFDIPILIGECGADGRLYERKPAHTGWQGNMPAAAYAEQLRWYHEQAAQDHRIIAVLPFLTDYQSVEWATFDTTPAHEEILAWATTWSQPTTPEQPATEPPPTVYLPIVGTSPTAPPTAAPTEPQPPQPTPVPPSWDDAPDSNWQRSIAFVLGQEGGLSTDPNDPGNYVNGVFVGTKYGISARAHPGVDVPNLTIEQAKDIYRTQYWQASHADQMPWPMCLAHLDLAVNGGVGRAQQALTEAGHDFTRYMAWRLKWYCRIENFDRYGRAWIRRCADLMEEATRAA